MFNTVPFQHRIQPAPVGKGFQQDGYWVWCGSVVEGEDGRFQLFAARWPKEYPFFHGYLAASEVVRASSDTPEGPYTFEEVVLPERGPEFWDGRMTHNPFIVKYGEEYLLFYIGTTYQGDRPEIEEMRRRADAPGHGMYPWYSSIRIGMARSSSVFGPWERPDHPTLDICPDSWDKTHVTNPAVCVAPDNRILMFYRSTGTRIGLAVADSPDHPFQRPLDHPVVGWEGRPIEDPFVFWNREAGLYEMVCKDLSGELTGEFHGGVHLTSPDAMTWTLAPEPKAWSRTLRWDDGQERTQANFERPFILLQEGKPAWLFAATADGPGPRDGRPGFWFAENTWNMVIPLSM